MSDIFRILRDNQTYASKKRGGFKTLVILKLEQQKLSASFFMEIFYKGLCLIFGAERKKKRFGLTIYLDGLTVNSTCKVMLFFLMISFVDVQRFFSENVW